MVHNKYLFAWPLLIMHLLFVQSSALAENKIIIGVEDLQYLPHYHSEKGIFSGFARDLFDAFANDNNLQVVYRPMPVTRLFKALVENNIDLKYPDTPNWNSGIKKGVEIKYSESVVSYTDGVMVKSSTQDVKQLGTVSGFTPRGWLDQIKHKQVTLHENPNFDGLLQQVLQGRLDGAYINVDVARYNLRERLKKEGQLIFNKSLPYDQGNYFASTSRNPELITQLNSWMKQRKPYIDSLKKRWNIQ